MCRQQRRKLKNLLIQVLSPLRDLILATIIQMLELKMGPRKNNASILLLLKDLQKKRENLFKSRLLRSVADLRSSRELKKKNV